MMTLSTLYVNILGCQMNNSIDPQLLPVTQEPNNDRASSEDPPSLEALSIKSLWHNPWLYLTLIALALMAWQWIETRQSLAKTQQELAERLSLSDQQVKDNRHLVQQTQVELSRLQGKLSLLEERIAESKNQQLSLEKLYQELARSQDDWAFAEIEQGVSLAAQQLQLTGNVPAAVLALESAEARLANDTRVPFVALRKVLAEDRQRLHAFPQADIPGMSKSLEIIIASVDSLPLVVDARPRAEKSPKNVAIIPTEPISSVVFWQHLGQNLWAEMRGLVRIQRLNREDSVLLAPEQVFFLRENLKLRLLNARLALFAHDQWLFRGDIKHAQNVIERYFDSAQKSVQNAQEQLLLLATSEINIALPNINESLSAVRNIKLNKERQ